MTTAIQEYNEIDAALGILRDRYSGRIYDVVTAHGLKEAKLGRSQLRGYRVALEDVRKKIKAPALERCRLIDDEAKRITKEISALEDPIDTQIKAEEGRKEAERKAREEAEAKAEAERVAKATAAVAAIKDCVFHMVGKSAMELQSKIKEVEAIDVTAYEFPIEAAAAKESAIAKLEEMWGAAVKHEKEAKRVAKERAEIERLKASIQAPPANNPVIHQPLQDHSHDTRIAAARDALKEFVENYGTIAELDRVVSTIIDYLAGVDDAV